MNTTIVLSAIETPERLSRVMVITAGDNEITINDQKARSKHGYYESTKFNGYSGWILSSYEIVYICNGEFAAFVIAWNLTMEYIVIVALISKALVIFIDVLFFGSASHLSQIIEMPWPLSLHFDFLSLLVPVFVGGKLCDGDNEIY